MTTVVRTIHITRKARRKRVVLGPEAPKAELLAELGLNLGTDLPRRGAE